MRLAIAQLNRRVGDLRRQRAAHPRRRRAGASRRRRARRHARAVAVRLSARGPRCCVRRSSTRARASSRRWRRGDRRRAASSAFPKRTTARATTRWPSLRDGTVAHVYRKQCLPNYTVFDEERYFAPGTAPCVFDVGGVRVGLVICEDVWFPEPASRRATRARRCIVVAERLAVSHAAAGAAARPGRRARTRECGLPVVYVNRVGGQDELVFDGASFVVDARRRARRSSCRPGTRRSRSSSSTARAPRHVRGALDPRLEPHVYDALVMGVRDYVDKNRFPGVLLGLSGGVDSALTLAIAVDALGRDRVRALMLPSPYNAAISLEDARDDGGHPRRALRRDPDRAGVRGVPRQRWPASSGTCRRTPPRRTSRRASAARC